MEGLRVLSFPIMLKTEGRGCGVDGYNLSNTNDFELDVALSPLSFLASFVVMYCASEYFSLHHQEIIIDWHGT